MNSRTARRRALVVVALAATVGCRNVPPPRSPFPDAEAALARMRATLACQSGVHGDATIDHFSSRGRMRGTVLFYASRPDRLRFDVLAPPPVSGPIATLTADAGSFALDEQRGARTFYEGPADACNIARLAGVSIPPHALVTLLGGGAPVLAHDPGSGTLVWDRRGHFVVTVPGRHQASERIELAPHPDDFDRPWSEQRVRVLDVRVEQAGDELYHAELAEHAVAPMAGALVDPDGLEPDVAPSGPACSVEVPRRIHVEVASDDADVQFRYRELTVNPPLPTGVFRQTPPAGARVERVECR